MGGEASLPGSHGGHERGVPGGGRVADHPGQTCGQVGEEQVAAKEGREEDDVPRKRRYGWDGWNERWWNGVWGCLWWNGHGRWIWAWQRWPWQGWWIWWK